MSKFRVVLIWLSVLFVFPRLVISDEPSEIETLLVEQEQAEMRNFRSGLFHRSRWRAQDAKIAKDTKRALKELRAVSLAST